MHAFTWTAESGFQDVHPLGWRWSIALGVDATGSVVGYGQAADGYTHAFAYVKGPDLVIDSYSVRPAAPKVHERLWIDVVLRNAGSAAVTIPASVNKVGIRKDDGSSVGYGYGASSLSLAAGATATFTLHIEPYTLSPGPFRFVLTADPGNYIAELDETNNQLAGQIDMAAQVEYADLVITAVTVNPPNPVAMQEFDFNVTVANQGTLDAVISYPSLIADGGSYSYYVYPSQFTPWRLAPGASQTFTAKATLAAMQPGTRTVTFRVDPSNRVIESNESNNTASIQLTVSPP